jgi:rhodanese-related sulfurtransferase
MKRIRREDYKGDGIYIDLDIEYIPYQKLIFEPEKYLNKGKRYYFYCKNGIKSKEVVMTLTIKGYSVTQVI